MNIYIKATICIMLIFLLAIASIYLHRLYVFRDLNTCAININIINLKIHGIKGELVFPEKNTIDESLNELIVDKNILNTIRDCGCPESIRGTGHLGYVYIGDNLTVSSVLNNNVLIFFCPAENHKEKSYNAYNGRLIFGKSSREMIDLLNDALQRGEKGEIPYSSRALNVIREEIKRRNDIMQNK